MEKFDQIVYHTKIQKYKSSVLERMWRIRGKPCTYILEMQKILSYEVPMHYIYSIWAIVQRKMLTIDRYLVKILLIAGKKAITKKW